MINLMIDLMINLMKKSNDESENYDSISTTIIKA